MHRISFRRLREMITSIVLLAFFAIILVAVMALQTADAADDARLDQLMKIIEQQQRMIEAQAETLQSLKGEVQALRRQSAANTNAVAAQAAQVQKQAQKVVAVEQRVEQVAKAPPAAGAADTAENAVVHSGEPRVALTISGQVNRALLAYGDGVGSGVFNVDNNNSGTRFRMLGEGKVTDDFSIGTAIEIQPQVNLSTAVSQGNPNTGLTTDLRRAEVMFTSKTYGKIWLGKGWTASDSTSEVDLSGTDVVEYASVSDMAGGLFFVDRDTQAFGPTIGNSFTDLDGQGRQNRLRYDTPTFYGFSAAASWTSGGAWDTALRYSNDFGAFKAAAAFAYSDGSSIGLRQNQVNGSVSALHESGLNLTVAAGTGANKDNNLGPRDNTTFWYMKGGYIADVFDFGTTNFSIDGGQSFDVSTNGDTGTTVGVALVQNLKNYGTQFYAGYRWYKLNSQTAQYYDINAGMAGARVIF